MLDDEVFIMEPDGELSRGGGKGAFMGKYKIYQS
jgi:hypothetical protein